MLGEAIGGFRIIRELGRGGMGIVYEAEQRSPRRHVALKVLPPELAHNSGVAARFREEANRMAQLDGHPNIATVYAAGEEDGTAYFAMQVLTGGDLEQRMHREGRLEQKEAAEIAANVADALDHAHRQGIIHRDIKPANIMFNAQGEPVVTDFGIAKAADEVRMTLTGMSVCTPEYASPEQVKGNPVDGRSDLYSLGVVLYRMVCGRPLFDCANPMTWALKHISEAPQPPGVWCPQLNAQLQAIILKCLQKEPSDRFANGAEMARALHSIDWAGACAPAVALAPTVAVATPAVAVTAVDTIWRGVYIPIRWQQLIAAAGLICLVVGITLVLSRPKPVAVSRLVPPVSQPQPPPLPQPPPADDEQTIRTMQERWRSSWVNHDLDGHISCFWPDANIDGTSRDSYRVYQQKEFIRQPTMEVTISNLSIRPSATGDTATATFVQHFRGTGPRSQYESEGNVTHTWSKRNGEWRISREDFSKISSHGH
ncbi:protein kinase [bacterium]|nr:protein kinase [bacterium]